MTLNVILPSHLAFLRTSVDTFAAGTPGAGMFLRMSVAPRSVSFRNTEIRESAGPATGVTGYYATLAAAGTDLAHHPNPNFTRFGAANSLCCDHAAQTGHPTPFAAGTMRYVIPNRIRRVGDSSSTLFATSIQSFTLTAIGLCTVRKGTESVSRAP